MFAFWCILSAIMIAEAFLTLIKVRRFRDFFLRSIGGAAIAPERWPRVALFAPCKGIDTNLRENIQSWLSQEYDNYRIFFIVESELDPVCQVLREFNKADLMIAGVAAAGGQKVHNLIYAAENVPAEFEAFAFVDSDCLLKADWLKNLIVQISQTPSDAATGYRWFSYQKNFGSLLRAVWNSSVLTLYGENAKNNFAWGGSMAITRRAFESYRVLDFWRGSVSDDYGLTAAMQSSGKVVRFVPGAIAMTSDSESVTGFLGWAFRQLLITRIYNPELWRKALVFHSLWITWLTIGFFYLWYFLPVFLMVTILQGIKANARLQCVPVGNRLQFWLVGPLIGLCNSLLLLGTLLTRKIVWRGREYRLVSRKQVEVR